MTKTILIVDDQPEDLQAISDFFKESEYSYEIIKAPSAKIALKLIEKKIPHLVITDWEMPVMDGIEFIKQLKTNIDTAHIPVIMCTGLMTSSENLRTALEVGASDYIRKPVDEIELLARTNSMLKFLESQQKIKEQKAELEQQTEEIRTQAEQLEISNDRLIEVSAFKEDMTGMIIHDLKNPLNTIINLADNEIVRQAGNQMLNMIMNILDVYKYENTEILVKTSNCCLFEISKSVLQQVNLLYEHKNIKLINHINNYNVDIECDIIERVLVNILTNAIKYSPNNGIITLQTIEQSPDFIRINITDMGPGIPKEKLCRVFDKFEQVIAKKSGFARSCGIGLTFCKLFVEAHGGEIGVESDTDTDKDKGTTFWFTLPIASIENIQESEKLNVKLEENKNKVLALSDIEKNIITAFTGKLQDLEVFDFTEIENTLNLIEAGESKTIEQWKRKIKESAYAVNQEKYSELIDMIK